MFSGCCRRAQGADHRGQHDHQALLAADFRILYVGRGATLKSLRTFNSDANPNIDAATVNTLASCEWIKKG